MPLSTRIARAELLRIAGQQSFERGEEYVTEGRVVDLELDGEHLYASVKGTKNYQVELWTEGQELGYSCTCPYFRDSDAFCKHCVAAGLAFLEDARKEPGRKGAPKWRSKARMSLKDVAEYLKTRDPEFLVSLLIERARRDELLKSRLLLEASKGASKIDLATFRSTIDRTLYGGRDFVSYESMPDYSRGLEQLRSSLRDLLNSGHGSEAMELAEYLLKGLEEQMGAVDDSDGYMGSILEGAQDLHHDACLSAKPDPGQLARRLFAWGLRSEWEIFLDAPRRYADVLGKEGMRVYTELAQKEWSKLPPLRPGQEGRSYDSKRFRITYIMEELASRTKSVETLVEVMSKDLSSAYHYLKIAETYVQARKRDKALEWAEEGLHAFPADTDSRLLEFLANEYHRRGRHDDAMQMVWKEFTAYASLEGYRNLKKHADRGGGDNAWKRWREKALESIREEKSKPVQKRRRLSFGQDNSLLVEIFLWEKDVEAAWAEAKAGGCNDELLLTLAGLREAEHPEDALPIYLSRVEPEILHMDIDSYHTAYAYMAKAKKLFKQLGKEDEWTRYLNMVVDRHGKKRNLMTLLKKLG